MTNDMWFAVLISLVVRAPSFLVGTVGLYFAFSRRHQHPRVSGIAGIGFAALLLGAFLYLGMQLYLRSAIAEGDGGRASEIISGWNLVGIPLYLIALGAIAAAVFIDRVPAHVTNRQD